MKIILFGGSFNPPHNGHVAVAEHLLRSKEFDEVWVVVGFRHPFGKPLAPFEDRLEMCRLAFDPLGPRVKVSDLEESLGKEKSYTIDTVRHLLKKFPEHQFYLAMGSDLIQESDQWKNFDQLKEMVTIYPFSRPGLESSPFPDVSSTQVREAAKKGEDISSLVPPPVMEYIRRKGLYR